MAISPHLGLQRSILIQSYKLEQNNFKCFILDIINPILACLHLPRVSEKLIAYLATKKIVALTNLLPEIIAEVTYEAEFSELIPSLKPSGPLDWRIESATKRMIFGDAEEQDREFTKLNKLLPEGPFKKFILKNQKLLKTHLSETTCETEEHIFNPNIHALEAMAFKYSEKYGVSIRVATTSAEHEKMHLQIVLGALEEGIEGPQFVGIVCQGKDYTHALPLVCFFGKRNDRGDRVRQFLIADVRGAFGDLFEFVLNCVNKKDMQVFYCADKGKRQADFHSCRVGAMQFVKHSLLALRDARSRDLLAYLKQHAKWDVTHLQKILSLPALFNYSEQIMNRQADLGALIPRDRYSKQIEKLIAPRSVRQHRADYSKKIQGVYTFSFACSFRLPKDMPKPSNVEYEIVDNEIKWFKMKAVSTWHTYLQQKGKKMQKEFGASA